MATDIFTPAVGRWSFVVGMIVAVLVGLAVQVPGAGPILFILGLLVGLLNVPERESTPFLIAVIALLAIGVAGLQLADLTEIISDILTQFISFVSAAGLVVAIKQALTYAKN